MRSNGFITADDAIRVCHFSVTADDVIRVCHSSVTADDVIRVCHSSVTADDVIRACHSSVTADPGQELSSQASREGTYYVKPLEEGRGRGVVCGHAPLSREFRDARNSFVTRHLKSHSS